MNQLTIPDRAVKELTDNRKQLFIAVCIYLLWWFTIDMILPDAFNPIITRFSIALFMFTFLILSYASTWMRRHLQLLFVISLWVITLHFYYLFYENHGDMNWIIGSFISLMAITLCLPTAFTLVSYSIFIIVLASTITVLMPSLKHTVFFPGILTVVIQANLGLISRLDLMKTLIDSNERFQLLFDSTFEGVLVHEQERIVDVNQSLAKMLRYTREEMIGKNVLEILHPNERDHAKEKMKLKEVAPFEALGVTKDGISVAMEFRAKNLKFDRRIVRLVTVQDLTDRKQAEKDNVRALTMMENMRVRDDFISIASHELKTPLSSLKLQTQMFERDLKQNHPKISSSSHLLRISSLFNKQVNRLSELIDNMLDVSRISAGRLTLDWQSFNFSSLIREIANSLHFSYEAELPEVLKISADRNRIQQVVENLLTNAIKYGDGKPVRIKAFEDSLHAVLVVSDQGIGIGKESLSKIFDRFERAISYNNISGLGLGLYTAKQIIEAHGGSISVESELHDGSTFTVRLPLK